MESIAKIELLERIDDDNFEQFKVLLEKFVIDTYVRNKPQFSEVKGRRKYEII